MSIPLWRYLARDGRPGVYRAVVTIEAFGQTHTREAIVHGTNFRKAGAEDTTLEAELSYAAMKAAKVGIRECAALETKEKSVLGWKPGERWKVYGGSARLDCCIYRRERDTDYVGRPSAIIGPYYELKEIEERLNKVAGTEAYNKEIERMRDDS